MAGTGVAPSSLKRSLLLLLAALGLVACAAPGGGVPLGANEPLVTGPLIQDIVTPFDRALSCLDGRINREVLRFSVGAVIDATGKEQLTESGTGKFVTQGAGDIVQSALFRAGVALVNRRDPRVMESEAKWGIRDTKTQLGSTFFITGSVNSLDFLPGSGFDVQIAGLGPRSRQHRILVGLDLSMTETRTGRVVANIPLQKQIVAADEGFGVGRFFGTTLVNLDVGNRHREALNFAMRQMLHLATFELLTQMMRPEQYADCWEMVETANGVLGDTRAAQKMAAYRAGLLAKGKAAEPANGFAAMAQAEAGKTSEAGAKPATPPAPPTNNGQGAPKAAASPAPSTAFSVATGANFEEEQSTLSPQTLRSLNLPPSSVGATSADQEPADSAAAAPGEPVNGGPPAETAVVVAAASAAKLGPPAEAAAPAVLAADSPLCQGLQDRNFARVTPLGATAAGNQILFTSPVAVTLCVSDRGGQFQLVQLQPNTPQKLIGQAPWRIHSPALRRLTIEYQGARLRLPAYVQHDLELLEKSSF